MKSASHCVQRPVEGSKAVWYGCAWTPRCTRRQRCLFSRAVKDEFQETGKSYVALSVALGVHQRSAMAEVRSQTCWSSTVSSVTSPHMTASTPIMCLMSTGSGLYMSQIVFAVPPDEKPADGSPTLSAGGTACALGSALLGELAVLVGASLSASRSAVARANEVAALLVVPELKNPLHALQETSDAFEAGLAVDSSEVRSLVADALRNLLPLCTLLQPAAEFDAAASVPASAPASAPAIAPASAPASVPAPVDVSDTTPEAEAAEAIAAKVAAMAVADAAADESATTEK